MRVLLAMTLVLPLCLPQPGPPGPGPKGGPKKDAARWLDANPPANAEQKELDSFARIYAATAARASSPFQARCFTEAAEACRRSLEHLRRVARPGPHPQGAPEDDRLRRVYFRLQLSDFFLKQISVEEVPPNPAPKRLLELARSFYERAAQPEQAGDYAAAADDLTHALENLAQLSVAGSKP